jgi:hypothetical protein
VRSLKLLKFHITPGAPLPSSSAPPLPRSSAAQGLPLPLLASTRRPRARPPPQPHLAAFPKHATLLCHPPEPPAATCCRRPPPLTAAAALQAPPLALVAPTRRPQAGRRPSSSPLAFSHARHIAPPLPELCPATTHTVGCQQQLLLAVPLLSPTA